VEKDGTARSRRAELGMMKVLVALADKQCSCAVGQ